MDNLYVGDCSILVYSADYSPEIITKILGISPTSCISKGVSINKSTILPPKNDWFYKVDFDSLDKVDAALKEVLTIFLTKKSSFEKLSNAEIKIRCFINSDYAQIGFKLSEKTLELLALAKKDFEISVFSGGGIEP